MINSPLSNVPLKRSALALALGVALSGNLWAQTLEERVQALEAGQSSQSESLQMLTSLVKKVDVSGFLSVRGGQIDSEELSYLSTLDDEWTFSEETVVGLQVDTSVSDNLSVSLQLKYSGISDKVELEWGYLEYAFQPDLKMRAGRLRAPGYMLSEYLDVGYAYPWAQVPNEVYGWLPFNRYEGVDLRYWMSAGDVDLRFGTFLGTTADQKLSLGNFEYTDQTTRFAGVEVHATYDIYTLRASYAKYRFELSNSVSDSYLGTLINGMTLVPGIEPYYEEVRFPGLVDYINNVMVGDGSTAGSGVLTDTILFLQGDGNPANDFLIPLLQAEGASLQAQLQPYQQVPAMEGETDGYFAGVGFSVDNGDFLLMTEFSSSEIKGIYPDVEGGYVMVGYRFGNWMPHLTLARMYTMNDDEFPDLAPIETNAAINNIIPGYDQLAAGVDMYTSGVLVAADALRLEQKSVTVGVRWDPLASLALKADVFYVKPQNGSYGFAMPTAILDVAGGGAMDASSANVEFPEPADNVTGVRLALDMVF